LIVAILPGKLRSLGVLRLWRICILSLKLGMLKSCVRKGILALEFGLLRQMTS
jgi:hypothetical protein